MQKKLTLSARVNVRKNHGKVKFLTDVTIVLGNESTAEVVGRRTVAGRATPEWALREFRRDPKAFGYQGETALLKVA